MLRIEKIEILSNSIIKVFFSDGSQNQIDFKDSIAEDALSSL